MSPADRGECAPGEDRYRLALEAAQTGVWEWNPEDAKVLGSDRCYTLLGYSPGEFPATLAGWLGLVHPEDREAAARRLEAALQAREEPFEVQARLAAKGGGWRWLLAQGRVVARDGPGTPRRVLGTLRDVTSRVEAMERLHFQAAILDQIGDLVTATDLEGRITYVNRAECEAMGRSREELAGQTTAVYGEDPGAGATQLEILERTLAEGRWHGEVVNFTRDGRRRIVECRTWVFRNQRGDPVGLCGCATDITERRLAEEERRLLERRVLESQKLESLGVLAGGIAHDFNNLLMAILGRADLARLEGPAGTPAARHLEEIEKAARCAADLCRQLLAYSGMGKFQIEHLDLSALIKEMVQLLHTTLSRLAVLELDLAADLPPIAADPGQIRQVVLNLLLNASEALGDRPGRVTLRTRLARPAPEELAQSATGEPLPPGPYVVLEVHDTGGGMDPETLNRIFEPFFTTKFTGRGLGLSAVLGIVKGHRGGLRVESEPGRGTSFRLFFPAAAGRPAPGQPAAAAPSWRGRGRVLLVDDEELVRDMAGQMLQHLGLEVVAAADGEEALRRFAGEPRAFACVLLDLTMPRLSGEEVLAAMRRLDPGVRIILSSGYNEPEATERLAGRGPAEFLQKPYSLERLREVLARMLG